MMTSKTKRFLKGAMAALALTVALGGLGAAIYGEREGGGADVLHFLSMFSLLVTIGLVIAAGATHVRRVVRS